MDFRPIFFLWPQLPASHVDVAGRLAIRDEQPLARGEAKRGTLLTWMVLTFRRRRRRRRCARRWRWQTPVPSLRCTAAFLRERHGCSGLASFFCPDQIRDQHCVNRQTDATQTGYWFRHGHSLPFGLLVGGVTLEGARQGEFTKLQPTTIWSVTYTGTLLPLCTATVAGDEIGRTMEDATRVLTNVLVRWHGFRPFQQVHVPERTVLTERAILPLSSCDATRSHGLRVGRC